MTKTKETELIILGTGPAGCTAAIYAARANIEVTVITGITQGGQLTETTNVGNWPGAFDEIDGRELMENMIKHLQNLKVEMVSDHIHTAKLNEYPFFLKGENSYKCKSLIIATGASARYLGLENEKRLIGKGVSACAVCDGFFYKGKKVAVIGGGNAAIQEALYLSNIASGVMIIHRRNYFSAEKIMIEKAKKTENIKIKLDTTVSDILGENAVDGIEIENTKTNTKEKINLDGVFVAIGHKPNSEIFKEQLNMDENGYIKMQNREKATATNIKGVFVAGDVANPLYQQAITAAGTGCMAALDAKRFLESK